MSEENVILVDQEDRELGLADKKAAHLGQGRIHRAFSIFVFNNKGEFLLQKRAAGKMLWAGYWSNTCCSHPRPGEDVSMAGQRRLQEELGFSCKLKKIGSFFYSALFYNIGLEKEFCHVLVGKYNGEVRPDPEEIEEIKWLSWLEILRTVREDPDSWTPWLKMELEKFSHILKNIKN